MCTPILLVALTLGGVPRLWHTISAEVLPGDYICMATNSVFLTL